MKHYLVNSWYRNSLLQYVLLPLSWCYRMIVALRSIAYQRGYLTRHKLSVPVIMVGNITVGGTGKTPLVMSLLQLLQREGYKPGVVSRGYGGTAKQYPILVTKLSDPKQVGDEPVLIATQSGCPVMVAPQRILAAEQLIALHGCDIILSDDGLQHYALQRDIEIAVVDSERRFGNGRCLPAGPLREPESRLQQVDFIVNNGIGTNNEYTMQLKPLGFMQLQGGGGKLVPLTKLQTQKVHAVAGIGNPQRFFNELRRLNLEIIPHAFPDHYRYHAKDFTFNDPHPIIMTAKDAVKCTQFATEKMYVLEVEPELSPALKQDFLEKVRRELARKVIYA